MKINFDSVIAGMDGKPIRTKEAEKPERDFTMRDVCVNALLAEPTERDKKIDGKEKVRRLRLADKIYGCHEPISLPAEDIVLLKDQIAVLYPILTTGRAWAILEGEEPHVPESTPGPVEAETEAAE